MRRIATIAAIMALAFAEAGATAQAGAPGGSPAVQSSVAAPGQPGASGQRFRDDRDRRAEKIFLSLAALTEFVLVFVIAIRKRHGGRPASP